MAFLNCRKLLNLSALTLLFFAAIAHADTQLYFVHNDHLGTPDLITDANQVVVWQAHRTPFGIQESQGSIQENNRFPGQWYDFEAGYSYNYFRDYDPSLGRYIQSDPIGLAGGVNTYAYVDSNPLRFTDPNGLNKFDKFFGLPKKFWQWYHRNEKRPGDADLDKDEAEQLYQEWKDKGGPGPDSKNNWKDLRQWFVPPSIDLACQENPCSSFCSAWGYSCQPDLCV